MRYGPCGGVNGDPTCELAPSLTNVVSWMPILSVTSEMDRLESRTRLTACAGPSHGLRLKGTLIVSL
jgi:hypothetical protein